MTDDGVLLKLDDVCKSYPAPIECGPDVEVLRGVSLELRVGQAVAVVGPSGCGKSTLLHIAGALDVPTSGSVKVAGRELSSLDEKELAGLRSREVGFVFQDHHLLPQCTVLENILVPAIPLGGPDAGTEERARRLLERVGLSERLDHRPGLLSGGERQRAAVVRALVNAPKILLADEPTGALDGATAESLSDLLLEIHREEGLAMVIVTHSERLAQRVGRALRLRDGRLESAEP